MKNMNEKLEICHSQDWLDMGPPSPEDQKATEEPPRKKRKRNMVEAQITPKQKE